MSMPSKGPKLFDVLPSAILKGSMRIALPANTVVAWQLSGVLPVSDGQIVVMDAASYARPRHVESEGRLLPWPAVQAEIWFRVIREESGKVLRVGAGLISVPSADLPAIIKDLTTTEGGSMPIDSATMMVGDPSRMKRNWQGGGPNCRANLGGSTNDPQRLKAQEHAAWLLSQAGFRLRREVENGCVSHQLEGLHSNSDLDRAESLIAASGLNLRVNVWKTETGTALGDQLGRASLARVDDESGIPYLFASSTGFGDGTYYWDALQLRGNLVGYLCDFMPPAESEDDDRNAPIAAVPLQDLPSPPLARPLVVAGQIACLRRNGQYLLVKVLQVVSGGYVVQLVDGTSGAVSASEVLPNPGQPVFQVGHQVLAHWSNGFMFPGTITATSSQGYTVEWHDGDTPLVVPLGTLTFLYWARNSPTVTAIDRGGDETVEVAEFDDSEG
ncbi:MAG: hypothetical protein ACKVP0_05115 [Pirellulaceae bacterium]